MALLNDEQRRFVIEFVKAGTGAKRVQSAAKKAGLSPNHGYYLMRHENVLAALREEATKRLAGAALEGVDVLLKIARNDEHKDQFKAAKELAAINGYTAEQRIVVEHIGEDSKSLIREIKRLAADLGMDARQLISATGIEDAEFTEVDSDR